MRKHKRPKKFLPKKEYILWKIKNKTPRSKKQISEMLNNPRYTFYMIYGKITTKEEFAVFEGQAGNQEPRERHAPLSPQEENETHSG